MKETCHNILSLLGGYFLAFCLIDLLCASAVYAYDKFPRLYGSRNEPGTAWQQYSRYHILSIGTHEDSQAIHTQIQLRSPEIKIIPYIASQEIHPYGPSRAQLHDLYNLIEDNNWWHWDPWVSSEGGCNKCVCPYSPNNFMDCWDENRGKCHSQHWPCTWNIDVTDACPLGHGEWADYRWNTGLAKFLSENVFNQTCGSGQDCWDGVFLDNYFYYRGTAWDEGERAILRSIRENDPDKLSVINSQVYLAGCYEGDTDCWEGSPDGVSPYADLASHFLWEFFLSNPLRRADGSWYSRWDSSMRGYVWWMRNSTYKGFVASVNGDKWVSDDGYDAERELHNYRRMRYGLTSTLMNDGYFAYRPFALATVWYDEYSVDLETGWTTQETAEPNDFGEEDDAAVGYLGRPLGGAQSSVTERSPDVITLESAVSDLGFELYQQVWQREFQGGLVIVNPTNDWQEVRSLGSGKYRRILGIQDLSHNNGEVVEGSLSLQPRDGIILVRVVPSVVGGWNWVRGLEGPVSQAVHLLGPECSVFTDKLRGLWSSYVSLYGGANSLLDPGRVVGVRRAVGSGGQVTSRPSF